MNEKIKSRSDKLQKYSISIIGLGLRFKSLDFYLKIYSQISRTFVEILKRNMRNICDICRAMNLISSLLFLTITTPLIRNIQKHALNAVDVRFIMPFHSESFFERLKACLSVRPLFYPLSICPVLWYFHEIWSLRHECYCKWLGSNLFLDRSPYFGKLVIWRWLIFH